LTETPQQRGPTADEQEATRRAQDCIQECHVEQLIMESKFLRVDSLQELLKVFVDCFAVVSNMSWLWYPYLFYYKVMRMVQKNFKTILKTKSVQYTVQTLSIKT